MLLCEVALGDMTEKFGADYYASNLPPGKSSTKGMGRTAPNEGEYIGDCWVPNGVGVPTGVNHVKNNLMIDSFIVQRIYRLRCGSDKDEVSVQVEIPLQMMMIASQY